MFTRRQVIRNVFATCIAGAASSLPSTLLAAQDTKPDERLTSKRITIPLCRIYLGELLEQLTQQTGMLLTASDKDDVAGEEVILSVADMTVADFMSHLSALFSYKNARWSWIPTEEGGADGYHFRRSLSAKELSNRVKDTIQKELEEFTSGLLAASKSEADLEKYLHSHGIDYAKENMTNLRAGLAAVLDGLSEEELLAVMRQEKKVVIPPGKQSKGGRALVKSILGLGGGSVSDADLDLDLTFEVHTPRGYITPDLFLHIQGRGGAGYLTGYRYENQQRSALAGGWILADDARTDAREALPVQFNARKTVSETDPSKSKSSRTIPEWMVPLAEHNPTAFFARVPPTMPNEIPVIQSGVALNEYLAQIESEPNWIRHKWHRNAFLLSHDAWAIPESVPPWGVIKRLRGVRDATPEGLIPFDDLVEVAGNYTTGQISALGSEFPVMISVADWQPILAQIEQSRSFRKQIESENGVKLSDPALMSVVSGMSWLQEQLQYVSTANALRLRVTPEAEKNHRVTLEVLDQQKTRRVAFVLIDSPNQ